MANSENLGRHRVFGNSIVFQICVCEVTLQYCYIIRENVKLNFGSSFFLNMPKIMFKDVKFLHRKKIWIY